MPKRSQKRRLKKRKVRSSTRPLASQETGQSSRLLPLSPMQKPTAKSSAATVEMTARHQVVRLELRRSLTIFGTIVAILIVLYFLLR